MLISTEGLVIKSINISDKNKLIAILTKDIGIVYAFVNNCKKLNSKLIAASELLTYCQFVLFKNKEKYSVNEATVLKQFPSIRGDVVKLSLCHYFFELVNELVGQSECSDSYLRLLLNSLYILDQDKRDVLTVKSVAELKLISFSGYMPNLICCSECLSSDSTHSNTNNQSNNKSNNQQNTDNKNLNNKKIFFSLAGDLICQKCLAKNSNLNNKFNNNTKLIAISHGVLSAMRYVIYSDISKIFSFKISEEDLEQLSKITQSYLLFQTNLNLPSLKYFNNII